MPQRLVTYQSLWGMADLPPPATSWDLRKKIASIASAGFDGVALSFGFEADAQLHEAADLAAAHGLRVSLGAASSPGVEIAVDLAASINADRLVLLAEVFPRTVGEGVDVIGSWLEIARGKGLALHLETHRGTITNDIRFTAALLEALPDLELSADLSHLVVAHGMDALITNPDDATDLRDLITAILLRSASFQGRISTANQIQMPLDFPELAPWVSLFRSWWTEGFSHWRRRSGPDDACAFICELGGGTYPVRGPDGRELSDRWKEAQVLRDWAAEAFGRPNACDSPAEIAVGLKTKQRSFEDRA